MQITIATLVYEQPPPYFSYSERLTRKYCETHGYRYEICRPRPQLERSPLWFTIACIRDTLPHADVVLYLDADAYMWNPQKTIESLVYEHMGGAVILAGNDQRNQREVWSAANANLGVFAVRRSREALAILDLWWDAPRRYDRRWLWRWPLHQGAFNFIVRPLTAPGLIKVIPYYHMNGTDGTFIRHLALQSDTERRELLQSECDRLGVL